MIKHGSEKNEYNKQLARAQQQILNRKNGFTNTVF
jgi:hypothetical protein